MRDNFGFFNWKWMKPISEDPMGLRTCPKMYDTDWPLDDLKLTFGRYDPETASENGVFPNPTPESENWSLYSSMGRNLRSEENWTWLNTGLTEAELMALWPRSSIKNLGTNTGKWRIPLPNPWKSNWPPYFFSGGNLCFVLWTKVDADGDIASTLKH